MKCAECCHKLRLNLHQLIVNPYNKPRSSHHFSIKFCNNDTVFPTLVHKYTQTEVPQEDGKEARHMPAQKPEVSNSAALSRCAGPVASFYSQQRPNSLHVPPQHTTLGAQDGGDDSEEEWFPSSEEERTPEGGRREFIGHAYKSAGVNNGEMVTPDMTPPPLNMVGGHLALQCYRRQFSDNVHDRHTPMEEVNCEIQCTVILRRQCSEPVQEIYWQ